MTHCLVFIYNVFFFVLSYSSAEVKKTVNRQFILMPEDVATVVTHLLMWLAHMATPCYILENAASQNTLGAFGIVVFYYPDVYPVLN